MFCTLCWLLPILNPAEQTARAPETQKSVPVHTHLPDNPAAAGAYACTVTTLPPERRLHRSHVSITFMCVTRSHASSPLSSWRQHMHHDTARHSATQHDTARHSTAQHDTARYGTTQHDTARHSTTQHDTARHSTTQHDTARHSSTCGDTGVPSQSGPTMRAHHLPGHVIFAPSTPRRCVFCCGHCTRRPGGSINMPSLTLHRAQLVARAPRRAPPLHI
jgi:hypothetical protein